MTPLLEDFVAKSEELVGWMDDYFAKVEIPAGVKCHLAMICFYIAVDHHRSMLILIRSGRYGSAFTLSRTVVESCVRGLWIYSHASDREIKHFHEEGEFITKFKAMLDIVESSKGQSKVAIEAMKTKLWKRLSGYTHTGLEQISRYVADGAIEPSFTEKDVIEMVGFVNWYNLGTAYRMSANLCLDNRELVFTAKIFSFANYSEPIFARLNKNGVDI